MTAKRADGRGAAAPSTLAGDELTQSLAAQVRLATADRRPLRIVGGDSKAFYGRQVAADPLDVSGHSGIITHDPSELVLTARAGTPLSEIEARLAKHDQMLGFEPPRFGPGGTLGGVVAAGRAGQRRPFAGAVRDFVLGVRVLDGRGQVLQFGGQVFKNVAGFDTFRLMAGALGQLGVILDVSLRVTPRPRREAALVLDLPPEAARDWLTEMMRKPTPLSGAFHDGQRLHLRLSGGEAGVAEALCRFGGEEAPLAFWDSLRGEGHPAYAGDGPLWRISLPRTTRPPEVGDLAAWDWAGSQRWVRSDLPAEAIWRAAAAAGGHATLFRAPSPPDQVFQPLAPAVLALHQRLKAALDPVRVLNPGRMYPEL